MHLPVDPARAGAPTASGQGLRLNRVSLRGGTLRFPTPRPERPAGGPPGPQRSCRDGREQCGEGVYRSSRTRAEGRTASGGGFEGDVEAELFELVDEVALASVGVVVAGEVVGAELVVGGASVRRCQTMTRRWWATAIEGSLSGLVVWRCARTGPAGSSSWSATPTRLLRRGLIAATGRPCGCASGAVLAGGLVVARAQPGPRGEMPGGREAGHVDTDLGDDDLSGALLDARDRREQFPGGTERGDQRRRPVRRAGAIGRVEVVDVGERARATMQAWWSLNRPGTRLA